MQIRKTGITIVAMTIVCAVFCLPVSAYEYSMTSVTAYNDGATYPMLPYRSEMRSTLSTWLTGTPGWTERFYESNGWVDDTDFGTTGQGLNLAELHYHYGHGGNDGSHSYLPYVYWPTTSLYPSEVFKKWDSVNKWVIMDACSLLSDLDWGSALKYSHGILGFTTEKTPSTDLPYRFLQNTIDNDHTIAYAWQRATQDTYGSTVTARVIFDTDDQLDNDHLSGQGTVAANEYPDDNVKYISTWTC